MKRSGNHTINRQYLYLMVNFPLIVLWKIGISGNYKWRQKRISDDVPGVAFTLIAIKIPFAYHIEQFLHAICFVFRIRFVGSGKTEWFLFPAAIIAAPLMIVFWILDKLFWFVLAALLAWVVSQMN